MLPILFARNFPGLVYCSTMAGRTAPLPITLDQERERDEFVGEDYDSVGIDGAAIADYELYKKATEGGTLEDALAVGGDYASVTSAQGIAMAQAHAMKWNIAALKFMKSKEGYAFGQQYGFGPEGVKKVAAMIKAESLRRELSLRLEGPAAEMSKLGLSQKRGGFTAWVSGRR